MYSVYDKYRDDPFEDDREPDEDRLVCRRCGKDDGLYWTPNHTGRGGFLMYDENGLHRCAAPANTDDFEAIS